MTPSTIILISDENTASHDQKYDLHAHDVRRNIARNCFSCDFCATRRVTNFVQATHFVVDSDDTRSVDTICDCLLGSVTLHVGIYDAQSAASPFK